MAMGQTFLVLALASLFSGYFTLLFFDGPGPLEHPPARRAAYESVRKSPSHYEALGVTTAEDYFVTSKGAQLFYKQWMPEDGEVRGMVLYLHRYGDTCVYTWEESAIKLAQSQYLVLGLDYEGFGMSSGIHGYIPSMKALVDDVVEFTDALQARPETSSLPLFLFGEAMGGAVAIKASWKRATAYRGAVLVAPLVKIEQDSVPPSPILAALIWVSRFIPKWKFIPSTDIPQYGFRVDEKKQLAFDNPVAYWGKARLLTALEILRTALQIAEKQEEVFTPILLLHGEEDPVTNVTLTKDFYKKASSPDKTLKVYEGAWHGLLTGEPDEVVRAVLADVVAWLDARTEEKAATLEEPVGRITTVKLDAEAEEEEVEIQEVAQEEGASSS